jgi:hypothetical protein
MPNLKIVRNEKMKEGTAVVDDLACRAFAVGAPTKVGIFLDSFARKKFVVPSVRSQHRELERT